MSPKEYQIPQMQTSEQLSIDQLTAIENNINLAENEKTTEQFGAICEDQNAIRKSVYEAFDRVGNTFASETLGDGEKLKQVIDRLNFIASDLKNARDNYIDSAIDSQLDNRLRAVRDVISVLFSRKLSPEYNNLLTERKLKTKEAEIGSKIFGPLKTGETKRAFFNDNEISWFFYTEQNGLEVTLHYEVTQDGIKKVDVMDGLNCSYIEGLELERFINATEIYYKNVMNKIYNKPISSHEQFAA